MCWISGGIEVEQKIAYVQVDEKEDFTDRLLTSNLLSDKESLSSRRLTLIPTYRPMKASRNLMKGPF